MKTTSRYSTNNSAEGEFEPDSNDSVLKNKLSITKLDEMEALETEKFIELSDNVIRSFSQDQPITVADIIQMHQQWLSDIYVWAGAYRTVNMAKGGFLFAAAHLLPKLMGDFEKQVLSKYTPCLFDSQEDIAEALAIVHVEFVLIHPFREGNGRMARLLQPSWHYRQACPHLSFQQLKMNARKLIFLLSDPVLNVIMSR